MHTCSFCCVVPYDPVKLVLLFTIEFEPQKIPCCVYFHHHPDPLSKQRCFKVTQQKTKGHITFKNILMLHGNVRMAHVVSPENTSKLMLSSSAPKETH